MAKIALHKKEITQIEKAVGRFVSESERFERFAKTLHDDLTESTELRRYIHFAKYRVKAPGHLRKKLERRALEAKRNGKPFTITEHNVFKRIQDLAGVRILHLHTEQMANINPRILEILDEQRYKLLKGPIANLWDEEHRMYFESLGIKTRPRGDTMYTSVHYVVQANTRSVTTCELQVRTLSEEVWGEVSHKINYPEETDSLACREQLKVLARVTSSCTRLVDAIFKSYADHEHKRRK